MGLSLLQVRQAKQTRPTQFDVVYRHHFTLLTFEASSFVLRGSLYFLCRKMSRLKDAARPHQFFFAEEKDYLRCVVWRLPSRRALTNDSFRSGTLCGAAPMTATTSSCGGRPVNDEMSLCATLVDTWSNHAACPARTGLSRMPSLNIWRRRLASTEPEIASVAIQVHSTRFNLFSYVSV